MKNSYEKFGVSARIMRQVTLAAWAVHEVYLLIKSQRAERKLLRLEMEEELARRMSRISIHHLQRTRFAIEYISSIESIAESDEVNDVNGLVDAVNHLNAELMRMKEERDHLDSCEFCQCPPENEAESVH